MLEQVHVFSILFSQIIIKKQVKKQLNIPIKDKPGTCALAG